MCKVIFVRRELKAQKDRLPVVNVVDENTVTITNNKVSAVYIMFCKNIIYSCRMHVLYFCQIMHKLYLTTRINIIFRFNFIRKMYFGKKHHFIANMKYHFFLLSTLSIKNKLISK